MPTPASIQHQPRPGGGALNPSYTPSTAPGTGAYEAASVTDANKVTPLKSFPFLFNGQNLSFFINMPRVVGAALRAALIVAGGGASAVGSQTIGGTTTAGNTVTATLNNGSSLPASYTVIGGDTQATIAAGLAAAVNASAAGAFIHAVAVGAVITYTANPGTDANAYTIAGAATGTATITPTAATAMAGGTNGSLVS